MEKTEVAGLVIVFLMLIMLLGNKLGPILPVALSIAVGSSMFPTINNGDLIVAVSKQLTPIEPGDIAIYKKDGVYVVHRVLSINDNYAVFKGDNNVVPDERVPISSIYFKVVGALPLHIWVPLFSGALSFYGVILIMKRRASRAGEVEVYSLVSVLYFVAIVAAIVLLSVNLLTDTSAFLVKPNPLPTVESLTPSTRAITVVFDAPLNGYVTCSGVVDGKEVQVPCLSEGNRVKIDILELVRICASSVCPTKLIINYHVNSPYNVTVSYSIYMR